ncbi:MAG: VWA domain-containing protein [Terriglobales bacterium]|jgi:Ca-activated chloride channel family protein
MRIRALFVGLLLAAAASNALGQGSMGGGIGVGNGQSSPFAAGMGAPGGNIPFDSSLLNSTMLNRQAERDLSPLENPTISVSKLDLKAPGKARHEYDKGVLLLNRKDYQGALDHLTAAITIYPDFVAAYNSRGSAHMSLGQNEQARDDFSKAVTLDDHLPISHLNLGCAELALKNYSSAEKAVKKAADIAPMDLQVLTALGYAELMNHDYVGVIATGKDVHAKKHKDAAIVHYYAAAAYDNLNDLAEAQRQLEIFLHEDPKSPAAPGARDILLHLHDPIVEVKQTAAVAPVFSEVKATPTDGGRMPVQMQKLIQESKEKQQIAEAEAMCDDCESETSPAATAGGALATPGSGAAMGQSSGGWILHHNVHEVAVLFAATDHGNSVPGLTQTDVKIKDDHRPPAAITGFLSESELPLRLGIVLDTSESITGRFAFEQKAATKFVQTVLTNKTDEAFVVGFSNSILLVQDFTNDQAKLAEGISDLAPAGGTALWDAVSFAAGKLIQKPELKPVARILVVLSDGEDNSSSSSLKEAIEASLHGEVIIYTVSTRDLRDTASGFKPTPYGSEDIDTGDRALKTLSERTGGVAYIPGSVGGLTHSLAELQQVIRSRYLVSYKPAVFDLNGQYHAVDISVSKSGHKLRVYARKGYYARLSTDAGGGT